MSNALKLALELKKLDEKIVKCMRCGTCQSVCPVFAESLAEGDVARGKLALLSNLSQEILTDAKGARERLERCLLCGSCQVSCPSGVSILDIFTQARIICAEYMGLNPIKKIVFKLVLCNPRFFAFMAKFAPLSKLVLRGDGNPQCTVSSPLLKIVLGDRHIPNIPTQSFSSKYGKVSVPVGKSGIKVVFFSGCVGDKLYVSTTEACLKIFKAHGVGVEIPDTFSCCGIPALASGDKKSFNTLAAQNIAILKTIDFDYIVTACASCTETIKSFWAEYASDENLRADAEKIGVKTMDISQFLIDVLNVDENKLTTPISENSDVPREKITYHDSCHLKKSLGIWQQPRKLIKLNPRYEFVEMKKSDTCCGCGGSFTLTHYDISKKIGERKGQNIIDSGADVVATGCPACMMQMTNALALKNAKVRVKHVAEIYAETFYDS